MKDCCAANQYSGCCEGSDCTSYSAIAAETVTAKHRSFRFLEAVTLIFYIAVAVGCGITLDNHFKREALINQERNIAWH